MKVAAQIRESVRREMPAARSALERLVRIPGIAFAGFDHHHLERSAALVAEVLRGAGLPDVRVVSAGGQPAVIGRREAPPGAPTVLLYAHHDVQPPGDPGLWLTDPFEPVERDGRLFGRGTADDKSGIMTHVTALRALGDDLPVGVVVFVEGEEEYGSASLEALLVEHRDVVSADYIIIADSMNWEVGRPAFTTALRGLLNLFVEVRTLDHALHSGLFGGGAPDALSVLCRLVSTLHDDEGNVTVPGLHHGPSSGFGYSPDRFRREAGLLDGVRALGDDDLADRLWNRPSVTVLGIDAPGAADAPNALSPSALARLSVRIAPGDSTESAFRAVREHLERRTPWGAHLTVTLDHSGEPCVLPTAGPGYEVARGAWSDAFGNEPVEMGVGGSIPFIATFQRLFPAAEVLAVGAADPGCQAHGPNESLDLGDFERACVAEALFLSRIRDVPGGAGIAFAEKVARQ